MTDVYYEPHPDKFAQYGQFWGVNAHAARKYYFYVKENTYFCDALYFPFCMDTTDGVMLCLSTPEYARTAKQNGVLVQQPGMVIQNPEWLLLDCWFYPGVVFGNTYDFASGAFPCIPCCCLICFNAFIFVLGLASHMIMMVSTAVCVYLFHFCVLACFVCFYHCVWILLTYFHVAPCVWY